MKHGKGTILKIFGLQTEKFYTTIGREKLGYIIVNTTWWLTDMCYSTEEKTVFLFSFSVFLSGFLFIK